MIRIMPAPRSAMSASISIADDLLRFIMDRLNHRPRKTLGFKTPMKYSVITQELKTYVLHLGVESAIVEMSSGLYLVGVVFSTEKKLGFADKSII